MPGSRPILGRMRIGSIARSAACGSRPRVCTAVTRVTLEQHSSAWRVRIPPWAPKSLNRYLLGTGRACLASQ